MPGRTKRRSRTPTPRVSKTPRQPATPTDTIMEGADDDSVRTLERDNRKPPATTNRAHFTFLQLTVNVSASKKGTDAMRENFCQVLTTLREADDSVILTHFKTDPEQLDNDLYTCFTKHTIDDPTNLPTSITAIGKYFHGAKPKSDGGAIWTQLRIAHNTQIETIIADTEYDLKESQSHISVQVIQHHSVAQLGFLKNMHPDIDVDLLTEFLNVTMRTMHRPNQVHFGLRVKVPYDGMKRTPAKKGVRRLQAIHIEVKAEEKSAASQIIKLILASDAFHKRYTCDVRLIPLFDRNSSPHTQEKIKRCILQHGQFCQCVEFLPCDSIDHLDQRNTKLKKTLRELILSLPDSHFINIDLNWRRDGYYILYPKKYAEPARDRIAHLGTYLHRKYGDHILPSLSAEM